MSAQIQNMSIEQKLQAMELLWDDLRVQAGDALSPAWHGDELARREAALSSGEASIQDWDAARQRIRDSAQHQPMKKRDRTR